MTKCPKCGGLLNIQPSISDNYRLIFCYNIVDLKNKQGTKMCGYRGYMKDGVILEQPEKVKVNG